MRHRPDRRIVLRRIAQASLVLGGSGLAAGLGLLSPGRWGSRPEAAVIPDRSVPADPRWPRAVIARGGQPSVLVRAAVQRVGGMARFVRPGETVLVKPNMAWDRTPEQGANTHPDVVAEVVRLCREAGAGRIVVADVPVHDPDRVAVHSGIERAARQAGAQVVLPPGAGFSVAALGGSVLERWEVFAPALSADRLINVPVVKDHGLSRLTCGLKNLYGVLGGNRGRLHQRIHETITDVASAFRPTLTVVDATRVMLRGGPQGGRLEDIVPVGAVAAGIDLVALDAWGASLLGVDPAEIGHIVLAQGRGLGTFGQGPIEEIHVGG
ncbi:MAG: DUF362 domain-containing protein [Acidobacteriota bacterium]